MRRQLSFAFLLLVTSSVHASLVFDFSFDNSANGGGTVSGVIQGLTDNSVSAATSVYVTSYTGPLAAGVGEYAWTAPAGYNRWTVSNGVINGAVFDGYLYPNTESDPLVAALSFGTPAPAHTIKAALFTSYATATWNPISPIFALRSGTAPAPATIALFCLGLLGANVVRRQREVKTLR
jgi:hypothetical protein